MKESGYYPPGAEFDPNAPYNKPIPKEVKVEVGIELGIFIDVEVYTEKDIEEAVKEAIYNRFQSEDVEINNITIWNHDLSS